MLKKKKKTNTLFHIKNLGREHPVTPVAIYDLYIGSNSTANCYG